MTQNRCANPIAANPHYIEIRRKREISLNSFRREQPFNYQLLIQFQSHTGIILNALLFQ
jgi:hypothetical protein